MPSAPANWRCSNCGFSNWPRQSRCYGCQSWPPPGHGPAAFKGAGKSSGAPLAPGKGMGGMGDTEAIPFTSR
eukprot:12888762-Prorocentrum_lima.AAC.1